MERDRHLPEAQASANSKGVCEQGPQVLAGSVRPLLKSSLDSSLKSLVREVP